MSISALPPTSASDLAKIALDYEKASTADDQARSAGYDGAQSICDRILAIVGEINSSVAVPSLLTFVPLRKGECARTAVVKFSSRPTGLTASVQGGGREAWVIVGAQLHFVFLPDGRVRITQFPHEVTIAKQTDEHAPAHQSLGRVLPSELDENGIRAIFANFLEYAKTSLPHGR